MAFRLSSLPAFLQEVRRELKSVQWPTRALTVRYTMLIVVVTAAVALITGLLDVSLASGVKRLLLFKQ